MSSDINSLFKVNYRPMKNKQTKKTTKKPHCPKTLRWFSETKKSMEISTSDSRNEHLRYRTHPSSGFLGLSDKQGY